MATTVLQNAVSVRTRQSLPFVEPAEGRGSGRDSSLEINLPREDISAAQDVQLTQTLAHLLEFISDEDITKQRDAAEKLTSLQKRARDLIRDMGIIPLLVDRLSSPDVRIREDMMTLLFRLAADEDQNKKGRGGEESNNGTATVAVIRSLWRIGPGAVANNTAVKVLLNISNIDKLKDSLSASGAVVALIDVLRYRKGLDFQKDVIATLMVLLKEDVNKAKAAEGGIAPILLRLLVHGDPNEVDMDGLLDLMAMVASVGGGYDKLNEIEASRALVNLVEGGKLATQEDKVFKIVQALKSPEFDPKESLSFKDSRAFSIEIPTRDVENCGKARDKIDLPTNGVESRMVREIRKKPERMTTTAPVANGNKPTTTEEMGKILGDLRKSAGKWITSPPVPKEFCCPISLELMKDPVVVATGQTYDRDYIQQWMDRGERKCPSTKQRLANLNLQPNYILKLKIKEWCEQNGVEITSNQQYNTRETGIPPGIKYSLWCKQNGVEITSNQQYNSRETAIPPETIVEHPAEENGDSGDHESSIGSDDLEEPKSETEQSPSLEDLARVQTLVETLLSTYSSDEEVRAAAAVEIHALGFNSPALRDEMVLAGAVSPLASLLSNEYSARTQEAAINALLILSLNDENKRRMADRMSPTVPAIVSLLRFGSEDAREKAASTLFSLSILDQNKVHIGAANTRAIPALVDVLSGRDPLSFKAQKDAATALLTLCIYQGNKAQAVRAGVVPHLIELLDDDSLLDLVLALVYVLSSHVEGRASIEAANVLPKLTEIMRSSQDRTIVENALTIFATLIMKNPKLIPEVERLGADQVVLDLCSASGPGKIKTKTLLLLDFIETHDRNAR